MLALLVLVNFAISWFNSLLGLPYLWGMLNDRA